jgi:ubiquinone/menaquinone biosynthesis C-methylase UbiE
LRWTSTGATEALALGIAGLRSGLFAAESLPLAWLQRFGSEQPSSPPPPEALATSLDRLRRLLEEDARQIARGSYPLSVLTPRDPLGHGWRLMRILNDAAGVARRRRRREVRAFGREARQWLHELPDYYKRNFHHQTDGYLSERSADLYDHQVELLFRGGADAMRRLILPPLKSHLGSRDGQGMHLLELGAGCGTATRSVAKAFPAAKITCVDISYPYIKHARRELGDHHRIDFVQGDAAALDFRQDRFDAVYSVFLHHELPPDVRVRVLEESLRVVKPRGFVGLVDSIQKGDDEDLDWALDFFPREFHEPYYASYAANSMETLMEEAGVESLESTTGYLSKVVWGIAPAEARPQREQPQE